MTAAPVPPRAAFQHRDFRLFMGARFFATVGMQMQSVAVGWHVYHLTRSPLALGWVGLSIFLPSVALSLLTGHTADRLDRRKLVMTCYAGLVACAGLLLLVATRPHPSVAAIYGVLVLFGATRAFLGPAGSALLPHLVPVEHFGNAVAWSSSIWQVATIVGPAAGGLIYGWRDDPAPVYLAAALLEVAALALVAPMRVRTGRMEKQGASLAALFAGVRYVWRSPMILGAVSLDLFAVLLGGATALLPVFARDILHVGPSGLGLLRAAPAVGAAVMAIFLAFRPLTHRSGAIMFACVALFGVATIVFGLSRSFVLSLFALWVLGASDMVSVWVRHQLVQLGTPSEMRGRVSAVNLVFIGASNELGEFESGVTAAWLGTVPAVVAGGIGTLLVVLVWCGLFPALRRADRPDQARAGP